MLVLVLVVVVVVVVIVVCLTFHYYTKTQENIHASIPPFVTRAVAISEKLIDGQSVSRSQVYSATIQTHLIPR